MNENKHSGNNEDLKKSETYLRAVLDHVLDGIISIDESRIIETFNPAAEKIFGYSSHEVIGRNVNMLMPEPYRSQHDGYIQNYLRTGVRKIIGIGREVEGLRKSGRRFPLDLAVTEMVVDDGRKFIGIVRDITERKNTENELLRLNEYLEQRVKERTLLLQESNEALQQSLRHLKQTQDQLVQTGKMAALGSLVSGVAHEINTPVGVCVTAASFLELKARDLFDRLSAGVPEPSVIEKHMNAILEASTSIQTNLNRASDLVKSFKQVAVDQATEEKRKFLIKEYIDKVLLSLRPKYKRTGHTIEVNCMEDLEITGPPGVFSQIITNLVMNSLTHGFEGMEGGRIILNITKEGDQCTFEYSDNGVGIPEENREKVFDPFFTTRRAQGGTGLGLHIVYNLVNQKLKGRIQCSAVSGKGVRFTIIFPCEPVEE